MKLILSRKGFDSSAGGVASPILPNGLMYSLPIPEPGAAVRYSDLAHKHLDPAQLVSDLTRGRITGTTGCHLDPDLETASLSRSRGWRPLFGQFGAAQGHLQNQGIAVDDLFLFFGWFRQVEQRDGVWRTVAGSPDLHVLYGWFQIGEVLDLGAHPGGSQPWMAYHAHCDGKTRANNTLYVAARNLTLPGLKGNYPGAGTFGSYKRHLQLTHPDGKRAKWLLPGWFNPKSRSSVLSYHEGREWIDEANMVRLESARRGQEFVLRTQDYPESFGWVKQLLGD